MIGITLNDRYLLDGAVESAPALTDRGKSEDLKTTENEFRWIHPYSQSSWETMQG